MAQKKARQVNILDHPVGFGSKTWQVLGNLPGLISSLSLHLEREGKWKLFRGIIGDNRCKKK